MDINREQFYNDKLYKKMRAELDRFIADWKTKPSSETVELAYELTFKEDILNSFDFDWVDRTSVPIEQAKALLSMKYPLDYLYQEWLDYDYSPLDMLRDSNNLAIEKRIEYLKTKTEKDRDCR